MAHGSLVVPRSNAGSIQHSEIAAALRSYRLLQQWASSLLLLQQEHEVRVETTSRLVGLAIASLKSGGRWRWSQQLCCGLLARDVPDLGIQLFNQVASCEEAAGAWQAALDALQQARLGGLRWSGVSTNVALAASAAALAPAEPSAERSARWGAAAQLLEEAQEGRMQTDIISWNSVLAACGRGRETSAVLRSLQELIRLKNEPDCVTYNTVMKACAAAMLWQKAHDVALRLQCSDIEADAFSLNELLTCSRWRMGMQLPTALKVQLTPVTCASLLYACEWRVAVHLLLSLKEAALETRTMNFNAVTSACSRASAWRNTLLLASMLTRSFSADLKMASSTLAACGASDEWERALSLFFELHTAKLSNAFTYGAAISACGRGGCWLQAFWLLEEAAASEIEPDDVMLNSAISACRSEWAAAIALLHRFLSQNIPPTVTTYCAVMTACDRCEQPRKVLSVFGACVADVQPNAVAVSLGLRACDAAGWWHAAMRLLHEAAEATVELDGQSFDAALGACRPGHWRTAMMLLAGAERKKLETEAGGWSAIVTTYCRAGRHQQLRSLMSSLRSQASIRLQRVER
ncbi:unnamed protein product [Symbiodinium sp. CCMP2456]|nr:unnamed protein product [Symbiodinium sp. CCMP2456]